MGARVGMAAPEFKTAAYDRGSIREISLRDYRGKWVVLFFYPADFTCV
jgi:alkyl hydroperoxide reductase subunit AhpC